MDYMFLVEKRCGGTSLSEEEVVAIIKGGFAGDDNDQLFCRLIALVAKSGFGKDPTELFQWAKAVSCCYSIDSYEAIERGTTVTAVGGDICKVLSLVGFVAAPQGAVSRVVGAQFQALSSFPSVDHSKSHNLQEAGGVTAVTSSFFANFEARLYALYCEGAKELVVFFALLAIGRLLAVPSSSSLLVSSFGDGGFFSSCKDAHCFREYVAAIVDETHVGCRVVTLNLPSFLGSSAGDRVELMEIIDFLDGSYRKDLYEAVEAVAIELLLLSGRANSAIEARYLVEGSIDSGESLECFAAFIDCCGGDEAIVEESYLLATADGVYEVGAPHSGIVLAIKREVVEEVVALLNEGSHNGEALGVGLLLSKQVGDTVALEEVVATLFYSDGALLNRLEALCSEVYIIDESCS